MELKEEKKPKRLFKILGSVLIVLIGLSIISLFIIPEEINEIKDKISESKIFKSSPGTGLEELGNVNPLNEEETSAAGGGGGGGGSGGGGSSGGEGSGGDGSGTSTLTPEEQSSSGILEIINRIDAPYTNHGVRIGHWQDASEDINDYDHTYGAMFNPSNVASKIVSVIDGTNLDVDSRPLDSESTFYIELSLVSQSGSPLTISSSNQIRISMPLEQYVFEDKTLTIQQYDFEEANYPAYDVKELIEQGNGVGIIELPDLEGSYNSEEPYAYFKLTLN